jgi:mannose-6-phosphate isomerase-like protein (cupin superfamily)
MKALLAPLVVLAWSLCAPAAVQAQQPLTIKPLAEKKVAALPSGTLYWRIENVPSLAAGQAATGEWGLAAESKGKAWLFTLGEKGGSTGAGTKVAEVGPIPRPEAAVYLLRINEATGPNGAITPVHSHPGSEAFYVLAGEQTIRGAHGTMKVKPGQPEAGHGADMVMQVSSTGAEDLHSLVMFVVDANRPFSSPAKFP